MDRNFIVAVVLSMAVLFSWSILIDGPQRERAAQAQRAAAEAAAANAAQSNSDLGDVRAIGDFGAPAAEVSVDEAIAQTAGRVEIDTPSLTGSINLVGGRIDDLRLRNYRETIDKSSEIIRILSPKETSKGHYTQQGWLAGAQSDENAVWTLKSGSRLTPSTPITLTRSADGLVYEKTFSVDEQFMFTVTQKAINNGNAEIALRPYSLTLQRGMPDDLKNFMILHEGPVGVIGEKLYERKFGPLRKDPAKKKVSEIGTGGWVGITSKNWLAAVIPPQAEEMSASLANLGSREAPIFRSIYSLGARNVAPGDEVVLTTHVFAGAKDVDVLQSYERSVEKGGLGVRDFDKAVDWGNFFFLTRPIFTTLDFFGDRTGNFGVAILILTLIIKLIMFPLANKAYDSMSKMRKLQPELTKIKERFGDDKTKQQQAMMELYKKEKMNPLAGCLPVLVQMPIFYALYKVLFVTIELRHEPFVLWIKDLSAPDPTTIFNLFGLLPYNPLDVPVVGAFLGIGVLPLLMGVGMWFQTSLNPAPQDPAQKQIMAMLPFIFVFIFAPFAAGLVLYWLWNTVLSVLQQVVIMKRNGVDINVGEKFKMPGFIAKALNKAPAKGEQ